MQAVALWYGVCVIKIHGTATNSLTLYCCHQYDVGYHWTANVTDSNLAHGPAVCIFFIFCLVSLICLLKFDM